MTMLGPVGHFFEIKDKDGVIQVPSEDVLKDPNYPFGLYKGTAAGIGVTIGCKVPGCIKGLGDELLKRYIQVHSKSLEKLSNYAINECDDVDKIKDLKSELLIHPNSVVYIPQLVFVLKRYSESLRGKMLVFLFDKMGFDISHIYSLIIYTSDAKYMELAKRILGERYTSHLLLGMSPYEFNFVSGSWSREAIDLLQSVWKSGIDPNRQHTLYGNILHNLIANESHYAKELIEILSKLSEPKFDFSARDSGGKTPLLCAAKLRMSKIVESLCQLHKRGIDIGLDKVDSNGWAPIMYSAALGDLDSFKNLLNCGALHEMIESYFDADESQVKNILLSLHVEPERFAGAPHNWLYFNDVMSSPVVSQHSKEKNKRVLISFTPEHSETLRLTIKESYDNKFQDNGQLFMHFYSQIIDIVKHSDVFEKKESNFLEWIYGKYIIKEQGNTFFDECVRGQRQLKAFYLDEVNKRAVKLYPTPRFL